jgi:hypothetical protein
MIRGLKKQKQLYIYMNVLRKISGRMCSKEFVEIILKNTG